ncbi:MAG: TraR/DksA C4-type zinc finger protein [Sulfurimonas sp.]|nr:TraR/DksA C4-type zinc finger protein [Sulfurimonas sp.]
MNSQQRQQIKNQIDTYIKALQHEISELEEKTKPIAPDCSIGRLTRQEMIQEQQVNEHALGESRIRINKLMYASKKVDKEEYGICVECEGDILFERLMLVPESSHCVSCKQELGL